MGAGQQRVQHPHRVTVCDQRVDNVRADEAGAAGDEEHSPHATP